MITFQKITFANFLSVGNKPVSFNLNENKTTLIHGVNGSGKSLLLDVLCYVLFNKSFRGVNLPSLINTVNKKGLMTEVEFSIGNTQYLVARGMKPKLFKIYRNGEVLDQQASDRDNQSYLERNILKMNQKTFTQVVILGSGNYEPFLAMNNAGRRDCVEDFLDIKIFTAMLGIAKQRLVDVKQELSQVTSDISKEQYSIELQIDRVKDLTERSETQVEDIKVDIKQLENNTEKLLAEIVDLTNHQNEVNEEIDKLLKDKVSDKYNSYNTARIKMIQKKDSLSSTMSFYSDNDTCHTCGQSMDEHIKTKNIDKCSGEIVKLDEAVSSADKLMKELQTKLDEVKEKREYVTGIERDIYKRNILVNGNRNAIDSKISEMNKLSGDTSLVDKEVSLLQKFKDNLSKLVGKKEELVVQQSEVDFVVGTLKDSGIKAQIVKNYLPVMNKLIRNYLQKLEFPIHFKLDSEFNESVSSPLHQDFCYQSFSEGQKGRIDIALLLTWRDIGKMKNSVSTNLLILDEVFSSSLDDTGKECLFAMIRYEMKDTNTFVIDHTLSQNFKDKFENTIEVNMMKGFSNYTIHK